MRQLGQLHPMGKPCCQVVDFRFFGVSVSPIAASTTERAMERGSVGFFSDLFLDLACVHIQDGSSRNGGVARDKREERDLRDV